MKKELKKAKETEYLEVYKFGMGLVGVKSGRTIFKDKNTLEEKGSFPFIDLSILKEKKEISEDLDFNIESDNCVKLIFGNIESLEVLERGLAFCRKELELKNVTP